MLRLLAVLAVLPAAATVYFAVFWRWFAFFRRHRALSLAMMTGSLAALGAAVVRHEHTVFARGLTMPLGAVVAGWMILIGANVLGLVADRRFVCGAVDGCRQTWSSRSRLAAEASSATSPGPFRQRQLQSRRPLQSMRRASRRPSSLSAVVRRGRAVGDTSTSVET